MLAQYIEYKQTLLNELHYIKHYIIPQIQIVQSKYRFATT